MYKYLVVYTYIADNGSYCIGNYSVFRNDKIESYEDIISIQNDIKKEQRINSPVIIVNYKLLFVGN